MLENVDWEGARVGSNSGTDKIFFSHEIFLKVYLYNLLVEEFQH